MDKKTCLALLLILFSLGQSFALNHSPYLLTGNCSPSMMVGTANGFAILNNPNDREMMIMVDMTNWYYRLVESETLASWINTLSIDLDTKTVKKPENGFVTQFLKVCTPISYTNCHLLKDQVVSDVDINQACAGQMFKAQDDASDS